MRNLILIFTIALTGCVNTPQPKVYGHEISTAMRKQTRLAEIYLVEKIDQKEYSDASVILDTKYRDAMTDIANEIPIILELTNLAETEKDLDIKLDEFIEKHSENPLIYLAKGYYYSGKASRARGDKWIHLTSQEQIENMLEIQKIAILNYQKAIEFSDEMYLAHVELANIYKTRRSDKALFKNHFEHAKKLQPASYWIWTEMLWGLTPRWGGSYKQMEIALDEMKPLIKENVNLRSLQGEILYDQGNLAEQNKEYSIAKKRYTSALEYGKNQKYSLGLGYVNMQMGLYEEGCPMIREAAKQRPYRKRPIHNLIICEKLGF